jgi:Tfp pilus assembly protein PilX
MNRKESAENRSNIFGGKSENEKGSAILIALFVMLLLLGFVALAVSRTTNETVASSNDEAETRAFEAAHASLEVMTRNFDKQFDIKLNPDATDITNIIAATPPNFTNYTFLQQLDQQQASKWVVMTGQQFQGLNSLRDKWELNTTATDKTNGVQVALRRDFYNNRIPIFQFGIFYEDDLEFHPGPRFDFGGRVHSNGNLFMMANDGLYFSSKVTTAGHIFTDIARNNESWTEWNERVYIKNASGSYVQLKHDMGSVLKETVNGSPVFGSTMPTVYRNANWDANENLFQGNLLSLQKPLELPIRISSRITGTPLDYIEVIKRGKNVGDLWNSGTGTVAAPSIIPVVTASADGNITSSERYYQKSGIRITLADSKAKLPGCASGIGTNPVSTACGIRLDGKSNGDGTNPTTGNARGYQPLAMTDGYQGTELNGERFYISGREVWIKVEIVGINPATNIYESRDITQDFLSLGITEAPPNIALKFVPSSSYTSGTFRDSRSILRLQRFIIPGSNIIKSSADNEYVTSFNWNSTDYNYVLASTTKTGENVNDGIYGSFTAEHSTHMKTVTINNETSFTRKVVPFPINMFDTREGLYHEGSGFDTALAYPNGKVPWNGVMSMVDIDVGNLRKFFNGDWDTKFPSGTVIATALGRAFKSTDVPNANGWVVYFSDRRGDFDFDGEYDMEDIYGANDGIMQPGEDSNENGTLQADYTNEAVKYNVTGSSEIPSIAAMLEHKYFRRGVRLVNAQTLPGKYDTAVASNTKGFTFASENGVYVLGNYNAFAVMSVGTPTPAEEYQPHDTDTHIPASVIGDSVTILSNNWKDARSFTYPFNLSQRQATETFARFAMLSGDTKTSLIANPNQGGSDERMAGGVHNFKRFLEDWGGERLNYTGSIINLYNSRNNNGAFKCCGVVYSPPIRNWVFDATFLDPARLPPGTPFFQSIQLTGFQRIN